MRYMLTFILTCLLSLQAICQKNEMFQVIDPVSEKEKILLFVQEFGSCSDSIKIQKFIMFPYFLVRHTCNPLMGDAMSIPVFTDSMAPNFDKEYGHNKPAQCGCLNPLYYFSSGVLLNRRIRDSITKNNSNILEYYFSSRKNKNDYCGWLINTYHFPLSFANIDKSNVEINTESYPYGNTIGTGIQIRGYGFSVIDIAKIKGEYKVVHVGYIWD